jgi:hypothetical protein
MSGIAPTVLSSPTGKNLIRYFPILKAAYRSRADDAR